MSELNSIAQQPAFVKHVAFTLWRLEAHRHAPGKLIKVPVHHDGVTHHQLERKATATRPARAANPATPMTAEVAQQWLAYNRSIGIGHDRPGEEGYIGLGFRPAGTGLVCLDIDHCVTPEGWSQPALDMMARFPGALLELSTSGTGLHIWFTVTEPVGRYGKDSTGVLEMYGGGQFIAAGRVLQGDASTDHTATAHQLLAEYWPPRVERSASAVHAEWDALTPEQQTQTLCDLRHALGYLDADDRDTWIGVGQATAGMGEAGLDLWDEWSATSDKYKGREDLESRGVSGDRTGFQSIFARAAAQPGYVNPRSTEARVAQHVAAFGAPLPAGVSTTPPPALEWTTGPAPEWNGRQWGIEQFREAISRDVTAGGRDLSDAWNAPVRDMDRVLWLLMSRTGGNCEAVAEMVGEHASRAEVLAALRGFTQWWDGERARKAAQRAVIQAIGDGLQESTRPSIMTLEEMPQKLVFATNRRVVIERASGRALTWLDAMAAYAASTHDSKPNEKGEVRKLPSLPVWLASPDRVTVDVMAWDPSQGELCVPPEATTGQTRAYNTWRGLRPMTAPADWQQRVRPFLSHIEYLVPNAAQRERFLQWLAHIVQCPGVLPHTSYLMIASRHGTGRSWLAEALARVLPGNVAGGVALGPLLDGKFNGRLSCKLLATVDETREGLSENRYSRAEALKRLTTEAVRHIDPKYGVQSIERNCCRWLMFSNHEDALPLDKMDRRIEVIANPDWVYETHTGYYRALYAAKDDPLFIASIRQYLATLDISTFEPGAHATVSEAKRSAIAAVTHDVDNAVADLQREYGGVPMAYGDLCDYIKSYTGDQNVRRSAVDHAVRRAGGSVSSNRIRIGGQLQRIVSLDPQMVIKIVERENIEPMRASSEAIKAKIIASSLGTP